MSSDELAVALDVHSTRRFQEWCSAQATRPRSRMRLLAERSFGERPPIHGRRKKVMSAAEMNQCRVVKLRDWNVFLRLSEGR